MLRRKRPCVCRTSALAPDPGRGRYPAPLHAASCTDRVRSKASGKALRHPQLRWGMAAIFCYVGAEVSIGSLIIGFLGMSDVLGLPENSAKHYLSLYWGGAMTGRFLGALALSKSLTRVQRAVGMFLLGSGMFALLHFLNSSDRFLLEHIWPMALLILANVLAFVVVGPHASRALGLFAIIASALLLMAVVGSGAWAMWAVIAVGLFNSILWSNIFTLAIDGLGEDTSQGSSLLVMMIVGGALIPPIQGAIIDAIGVQKYTTAGFHISFLLPMACYAYLVWYGLRGSTHQHRMIIGI